MANTSPSAQAGLVPCGCVDLARSDGWGVGNALGVRWAWVGWAQIRTGNCLWTGTFGHAPQRLGYWLAGLPGTVRIGQISVRHGLRTGHGHPISLSHGNIAGAQQGSYSTGISGMNYV